MEEFSLKWSLDASGGFFPLSYRLQYCIKMREIFSRFQTIPVPCSQECVLMVWYSGYNSWGKHPVLSPGFLIKRQWDRAACEQTLLDAVHTESTLKSGNELYCLIT